MIDVVISFGIPLEATGSERCNVLQPEFAVRTGGLGIRKSSSDSEGTNSNEVEIEVGNPLKLAPSHSRRGDVVTICLVCPGGSNTTAAATVAIAIAGHMVSFNKLMPCRNGVFLPVVDENTGGRGGRKEISFLNEGSSPRNASIEKLSLLA